MVLGFNERRGLYWRGHDLEAERAASQLTGARISDQLAVVLGVADMLEPGSAEQQLDRLLRESAREIQLLHYWGRTQVKDALNPLVPAVAGRLPRVELRVAAGGNPNTPARTLHQLSQDEAQEVRWEVARNPSCPPELLAELAAHSEASLRWQLCDNPSLDSTTLDRLLQDPDQRVREQAERVRKARHRKEFELG